MNKQGVRSDTGFVVQFTGRFTATYQEGRNTVTLYVEDGIKEGKPCIIVTPNAFERWDDGTLIPSNKRKELFDNFKKALNFQGLGMVVD